MCTDAVEQVGDGSWSKVCAARRAMCHGCTYTDQLLFAVIYLYHILSFFIISIQPVFMFKNNYCTSNYNLDGRVDDNGMSYVAVIGDF